VSTPARSSLMLVDPDEWKLAARKYPESRHLAMELREALRNHKRQEPSTTDPEGAA
jgi:hypothetical protein